MRGKISNPNSSRLIPVTTLSCTQGKPSAKVRAGLEAGLTQPGGKAVASILGDMEKGGAVEARSIVGDMLMRARKAGVAAPNLRFAYAHLQAYEARRARGGLKS